MRFKKSDIILLIVIFIFIMSFLEIKYFSYKSEPILLEYACNKTTNIISSVINETINKKIYKYNYNDIIQIEKDNSGYISSVDFNNEIVNDMLFIVNDKVLKDIKQLENGDFDKIESKYLDKNDRIYYIPYSIIYGSNVLNNLGPKIPFRINMIGSTNNEAKINVKDYGINSSIVEVELKINIKLQVILPFKSKEVDITKSIILDSKIIQGKVPNYYGGLYSAN